MTEAFKYQVDQFIEVNSKYFEISKKNEIRDLIYKYNIPMSEIKNLKFKSPITATVLAVFGGCFGIDRFYAGDYILGILKLLTGGLMLIGWAFDFVWISRRIKNKNYEKLVACITGEKINTSVKLTPDTITRVAKDPNVQEAFRGLVNGHNKVMDTFDIDSN